MRLMLATDGSTEAGVATALIESIGWPAGTTVDVVRVLDPTPRIEPGPWPAVVTARQLGLERLAIDAAEADLETIADAFRAVGLRAHHALLTGSPPARLVEWIAGHRPDLVVVGSRGLSGIGRVVLGSVSSALVDRSTAPVLVARGSALERVVIAVDGSPFSEQAVATCRSMPFLAAAEIRILSIAHAGSALAPGERLVTRADGLRHPRSGEDDRLEHEEIAERAARILAHEGFAARAEVRSGSAVAEILDYAAAWHADLVVVGTHGRTGLSRLIVGSVARGVLDHARCSVLVVRPHEAVVRGGRAPVATPAWTLIGGH